MSGASASATGSPRTEATAAPAPGETGVAVPTCGEPEVRPTFWIVGCGDAAYQLKDLIYTAWGDDRATATGTLSLTRGAFVGEYPMRATFDMPVAVKEFGDRSMFSRLKVAYDAPGGPGGEAGDEFLLSEMWEQARVLLDTTPRPCRTDVPDCAPDVG